MKWDFKTGVKGRILANVVTFTIMAAIVFLLWNIQHVFAFLGSAVSRLSPFIWGFVIAYILNGLLKVYEKRVLFFIKEYKHFKRLKRMVSVTLTYLTVIVFLGLVVWLFVPQLVRSVQDFINNLQGYIDRLNALTDRWGIEYQIGTLDVSLTNFVNWLTALASGRLGDVLQFVINVVGGASKVVIAFIVSVYILYNKELFSAQIKKIGYALMPEKHVVTTTRLLATSDKIFAGFITGRLLNSTIIGVLCFIGLSIMRAPYAAMLSLILGVTDFIPMLGPFIGAIPCALIIFVAKPELTIWFIIFIIVLQQIDGNVISPRILGDAVKLPAFWVLFALVVGGGLFGFVGILIGVPMFAVIYSLVREFIEYRLSKKHLSMSTENYVNRDEKG